MYPAQSKKFLVIGFTIFITSILIISAVTGYIMAQTGFELTIVGKTKEDPSKEAFQPPNIFEQESAEAEEISQ